MRKIDNLGRIVIPKELREKYGLHEGADIDFTDSGNGILVKALINQCKICQNQLQESSDFPLCEECAKKLIEKFYANPANKPD